MVGIPWFKVDDGLPTSRKLLSIPRRMRLPALGLWTVAGAWSAGELTDGHVPGYMLEEWGATDMQATCLVNAGLWYAERDGYVFHDWDDYQPTRDEVHAKREAWKDRQRKARSKRESQGESRGDTQGDSQVESTSPVPSRPVPSSTKKKDPSASRGSRLDPSWLPSKEDVAKIRSECPSIDPQREHVEFVDYWIGVPGAKGVKLDWPATWRNWMRRKQRDSQGAKQTPTQKAQRTVMLATDLVEIEG